MNTPNYPDTMTPNTPAAANAQGTRDFWRFDRRSVVLGLTAGVVAIAAALLVLGPLAALLDTWPGGWTGEALSWLATLALMALTVLAIPRIVAAYDRREAAERREAEAAAGRPV